MASNVACGSAAVIDQLPFSQSSSLDIAVPAIRPTPAPSSFAPSIQDRPDPRTSVPTPSFPTVTPGPFSIWTESPTDFGTVYGSYVWQGNCQIYGTQKALWYRLPERNDEECMRARLVERDPSIVLFSGECGELSCTGTSSYGNNGEQQILWEAKAGVTYYVVVRGSQSPYGPNAEFSLEIEAVPCLENDSCVSSTRIASLPFVDVTSNEMALQGVSGSARSCNQFSPDSRGVWYSVVGTGECLRYVVGTEMCKSRLLGISSRAYTAFTFGVHFLYSSECTQVNLASRCHASSRSATKTERCISWPKSNDCTEFS